MIARRLSFFALVGTCGFVVDSLVFTAGLMLLHLPLLMARTLAFFAAASVTWVGNRRLTFSDAVCQSKWLQWRKALMGSGLSLVPNLTVFHVVVILTHSSPFGTAAAFIAGIAAGMLSNFYLCQRWVFTSVSDPIKKAQNNLVLGGYKHRS